MRPKSAALSFCMTSSMEREPLAMSVSDIHTSTDWITIGSHSRSARATALLRSPDQLMNMVGRRAELTSGAPSFSAIGNASHLYRGRRIDHLPFFDGFSSWCSKKSMSIRELYKCD